MTDRQHLANTLTRIAKRWWPSATVVIVIVFFYFPEIIFAAPIGPHFIRQTDSLAFAEHYFRYHNRFISPAVFDLRVAPDDGHAAAEFPLIYWIAAKLYALVGDRYWVLRSLHLVPVIGGHVALANAVGRWFNDRKWGVVLSLWAFGSSVVMFYACNFLPDAAAYGCVLLGWSFVLDGMNGQRSAWYLPSAVFFTLAALLKAPLLMHFVVVAMLQLVRARRSGPVRQEPGRLLPFAIGSLLAVGWHAYAIAYDHRYATHYFMTWAEPIWGMTRDGRQEVMDHVMRYWWTKYLYPSSWHVVLVLTAIALFFWRMKDPAMRLLAWSLLLANACFFMLFFAKFKDHDYYFMSIAPGLMLTSFIGLWTIRSLLPQRWMGHVLLAGASVLMVLSLNYGQLNLARRYAAPDRFSRTGVLLASLPMAMDTLRVPANARVLVLGDSTPNGALLILGRRGWSFPGDPRAGGPGPHALHDQADYFLCVDQLLPPDMRGALIARDDHWSLWRSLHRDAGP